MSTTTIPDWAPDDLFEVGDTCHLSRFSGDPARLGNCVTKLNSALDSFLEDGNVERVVRAYTKLIDLQTEAHQEIMKTIYGTTRVSSTLPATKAELARAIARQTINCAYAANMCNCTLFVPTGSTDHGKDLAEKYCKALKSWGEKCETAMRARWIEYGTADTRRTLLDELGRFAASHTDLRAPATEAIYFFDPLKVWKGT
ncbi:hypothetical protein P7C73_g6719, partial [Tremellales sp. Uapishka_1]